MLTNVGTLSAQPPISSNGQLPFPCYVESLPSQITSVPRELDHPSLLDSSVLFDGLSMESNLTSANSETCVAILPRQPQACRRTNNRRSSKRQPGLFQRVSLWDAGVYFRGYVEGDGLDPFTTVKGPSIERTTVGAQVAIMALGMSDSEARWKCLKRTPLSLWKLNASWRHAFGGLPHAICVLWCPFPIPI